MKARGAISSAGGHQAHLSALAYMSDSYFIGTIARVHKLWRYSAVRKDNSKSSIDEDVLKKLLAMDSEELKRVKFLDPADLQRLERYRNGEDMTKEHKKEIGMMVSLDHTIYFHNPRKFRADEWMFTEMESPWAGDGRGLVFQKIFTRDGTLIATCVQEVSVSFFSQLSADNVLGTCSITPEYRKQAIIGGYQAYSFHCRRFVLAFVFIQDSLQLDYLLLIVYMFDHRFLHHVVSLACRMVSFQAFAELGLLA